MAERAHQLEDFPHIIPESTRAGTIGRIIGTRLKVHDIVLIWRSFNHDASEVSRRYFVEQELVDEALAYAAAHPDEVAEVIRYVETFTFEDLKAIVPDAEQFIFKDSEPQAP